MFYEIIGYPTRQMVDVSFAMESRADRDMTIAHMLVGTFVDDYLVLAVTCLRRTEPLEDAPVPMLWGSTLNQLVATLMFEADLIAYRVLPGEVVRALLWKKTIEGSRSWIAVHGPALFIAPASTSPRDVALALGDVVILKVVYVERVHAHAAEYAFIRCYADIVGVEKSG